MSCYAIAIGGTGARCLEALIHLCAAGYGPKDELHIVLVDPDASNGNTNKTIEMIRTYRKVFDAVDPISLAAHADDDERRGFFTTPLRYAKDESEDIQVWSPPNKSSFLNFLTPENKSLTTDELTLLKLFYTEDELSFELEKGFRARTNIGSVIMVQSLEESIAKEPWNSLFEKMIKDVSSTQPAKVFLFGSIFGGTGASGLPTLGNIMKKDVLATSPLFSLGAAILLPYFHFSKPAESGLSAQSDHFLLNTQAALKYYYSERYLMPYNYIYLIGENKWRSAGKGYIGGEQQKNPNHFIELIAALAAMDFYSERPNQDTRTNTQFYYYAARESDNAVTWRDLPYCKNYEKIESTQHKLLTSFIYFTTAAFVWKNFMFPMLQDKRLSLTPYLIPWYYKYFVRVNRENMNLTNEDSHNKIKDISKYFNFYLDWLCEIHKFDPEQAQLVLFDSKKVKIDNCENLGILAIGLGEHKKRLTLDNFWKFLLKVKNPDIQEPVPLLMYLISEASKKFCDYNYNFSNV